MKNNFFQKSFLISLSCFFLLGAGTIITAKQKKRMKILMIVASFPTIHNICLMNQATGLIDRGHDVHIFAYEKGDFTKVQEDVIKYNLINKTMFKLPASLDDYDIVMFQMGHKLFDIRKTHNYKGKIVVCLRGYDITGFLKENPHYYDYYFEACDLFLPVCNAFKKILVRAGCDPHKIVVHHSSIDCSKFKFLPKNLPKNDNIYLVSTGRLVEKKGFIYSLIAVERLLKKYPRLRYMIIGDGVLKEGYQQVIRMLKIDKKVTIYNWMAHKEYIDFLSQAHICILPSVTARNNNQEGIANVLKEAMAMGLLVIATDHSGNAELIDNGISGLLVPERDAQAVYDAVEYLLKNPERWLPMQIAGEQKVREEFDKEKENDKLEAMFYDLLAKNGNH